MKKRILIAFLGISLCLGSYEVYGYFSAGATCNPNGNCKACKNCKYCKHCSKNGGSCSVCR